MKTVYKYGLAVTEKQICVMPSCFFKIKMYDKYLFSRQTKRFGANKN